MPVSHFSPRAHFEILASRRLGLDRSEFDVALDSGKIDVQEVFQITERGTLWEWVVLSIKANQGIVTLYCMNWIPQSGAFIGVKTFSRIMKAAERKRYEKFLPKFETDSCQKT